MTVSKRASVAAKTNSKASSAPQKSAEKPVAQLVLEQVEVCREQAREAARLKRFCAALGLFATAASLCRHAQTIETDAPTAYLIGDHLRQIDLEAAAYFELARAVERPRGRV